ncbi:MAG: hypothetical protein OXG06_03685 [Gammaproteobacteria bacterium]|nr:hypothetical protein [Gammaproteobacteria bacterium]
MLEGEELAAWERKQAANRRAYDRERREKIGKRWHRYGLAVGSSWLGLKAVIALGFLHGLLDVFFSSALPWWVPVTFALTIIAIIANVAQHWND